MYLFTTWTNREKEKWCILDNQTVWALPDKDMKNKWKDSNAEGERRYGRLNTTPSLKLIISLANLSVIDCLIFQRLYNITSDWLWAWSAESYLIIKNTFAFRCPLYQFPEEYGKQRKQEIKFVL